MSNEVLAFADFALDAAERRLSRDGQAVDLSQRYLDALILLARHPGELITKDRFMDEVWRGVPVTDEALTQCVRSLRKALGDEAARPRFIETVPKHGYRFVADVTSAARSPRATWGGDIPEVPQLRPAQAGPQGDFLLITAAGLAGGAASGLVGGIGYGLLAATDPPAGTGAISVVLVMTCICLAVGLLGGLGVGAGIAGGRLLSRERLFPLMLGGALGGLVVGTLGRLIGLDAFALLVGSRPVAITGGSEGLLVGALAGAALWSVWRMNADPLKGALSAAIVGALGGVLVTAGGGQMMAGSLATLAAAHPEAPLGHLLSGFPPLARYFSSAVEGATFLAALTLAFTLALRSRAKS